jgi:hypothetical protein
MVMLLLSFKRPKTYFCSVKIYRFIKHRDLIRVVISPGGIDRFPREALSKWKRHRNMREFKSKTLSRVSTFAGTWALK